MRCWRCHANYGENIKICVKCGINLVTGQSLSSSIGGLPQGPEPIERRPWLADTLPGLFVMKACVAGVSLAALGYFMLFYFTFMMSIPIVVVGAILTAQAISFLIVGELWLLHTAALEFRSKDWTTLLTLLLVPVTLWIFALKISYRPGASALEDAKFKVPELFTPDAPKPPPPPPASPYIINDLVPPGSRAGEEDEPPIAIPHHSTLFVAKNGDIYITGRIITKYNAATGKIDIVAGSDAEPGFYGNGGPATKAVFNTPSAVAVDTTGNVYVADINCIRKVDARTGKIDALIGDGGKGPSTHPETGVAKEVQLAFPKLLCVDLNGNVYEIDQGPLLRKMDAATGYVTVV